MQTSSRPESLYPLITTVPTSWPPFASCILPSLGCSRPRSLSSLAQWVLADGCQWERSPVSSCLHWQTFPLLAQQGRPLDCTRTATLAERKMEKSRVQKKMERKGDRDKEMRGWFRNYFCGEEDAVTSLEKWQAELCMYNLNLEFKSLHFSYLDQFGVNQWKLQLIRPYKWCSPAMQVSPPLTP